MPRAVPFVKIPSPLDKGDFGGFDEATDHPALRALLEEGIFRSPVEDSP
jgi:hypothetical protein